MKRITTVVLLVSLSVHAKQPEMFPGAGPCFNGPCYAIPAEPPTLSLPQMIRSWLCQNFWPIGCYVITPQD